MGVVGVVSCAHHAWIDTSRYMGTALAKEISDSVECRVHVPVDKNGLIAIMNESNYLIIHTHGAFDAFIDQRCDNTYKKIVSLNTFKSFPSFSNLKLVIITACSCASGENENNIACEFSKHIAKDGLVIANRYDVYGGYIEFGDKNNRNGWVAYQNGKIVIKENEIPAKITMQDAFKIFLNYRKDI